MADPTCVTTIDWDATGSMISGLAAWAGVAAVIWAAIQGFSGWKKQKLEERRMDTAERMMALTYRLERAFPAMRAPFQSASEIQEANAALEASGFKKEGADEDRWDNLSTAQVTLMRAEHYAKQWEALFDVMPLAKVFFGEQAEALLLELWSHRNKVIAAAQSYSRLRREDATADRLRAVLWFGGDADGVDALADAVSATTKKVEGLLLPVLRSGGKTAESRAT